MASLPGIIIRIGAETRDAVQGINRVNKALDRTMTPAQKVTGVMKKMGPALGMAAVAAGAAATAIGVDAVQAFMEAQKASERLDKTLDNLGLADQSKAVQQWADDMQYAANIADDELLDAFQRIVRTGRTVRESQQDVALAADIAAGADKDLTAVVDALAAAYTGNRGKLTKLGTGLDVAFLKTASLEEVTAKLAETFGGQNATKANSLSGSVEGVTNALGELQESFGAGLVGNIDDTNTKLQETEQRLRDIQPEAERAGAILNNIGLQTAEGAARAVDVLSFDGGLGGTMQRLGEWMSMGFLPDDAFGPVTESAYDAARAAEAATLRYQGLADAITGAASAWTTSGSARWRAAGAGTDWAAIDERLKGARLRAEWDRMDKKNARRNAAREARRAAARKRRGQARTGQKLDATDTPTRKSC